MNNVYLNGLGNVSPQKTIRGISTNGNGVATLLDEPIFFETNQFKCPDPGYKDFIPGDMIRRMGRIIKMGVTASKLCLRDAATGRNADSVQEIIPDAIITGTGLGCMEDTEKFLTSMIRNNEEFLTPTSFIQSTHNTVAGQIALLLKCHGYNFTYVHRGISFESALTDAMIQLQLGEFSNALVGGSDELTANSFAITSRLGYWKQKPVHPMNLLDDPQRGTIAGEGASFFFLENQKNQQTYAGLAGVATFLKPSSSLEVSERLQTFLASHGLTIADISLVVLGLSGDPRTDQVYHALVKSDFQNSPLAFFKHLCGEYHTATAFATWLAAMMIKTQSVPEVVRVKGLHGQIMPGKNRQDATIEYVLIYNHYRENNHAFILLSRP